MHAHVCWKLVCKRASIQTSAQKNEVPASSLAHNELSFLSQPFHMIVGTGAALFLFAPFDDDDRFKTPSATQVESAKCERSMSKLAGTVVGRI